MPLWTKSSTSALPALQPSPSHLSRVARIACGRHIANMSTDTKQQKSAKFGHLPLSTSGPQETSLTVWHAHTRVAMGLTHCVGQCTSTNTLLQQGLGLHQRRARCLQASWAPSHQRPDPRRAGQARIRPVLLPTKRPRQEHLHDESEGAERSVILQGMRRLMVSVMAWHG